MKLQWVPETNSPYLPSIDRDRNIPGEYIFNESQTFLLSTNHSNPWQVGWLCHNLLPFSIALSCFPHMNHFFLGRTSRKTVDIPENIN